VLRGRPYDKTSRMNSTNHQDRFIVRNDDSQFFPTATATAPKTIMSTFTARSRPADLSLPADGGAWLKQPHQNPSVSELGDQHDDQSQHQQQQQQQQQQQHQYQQQTQSLHAYQNPVSLHNEPRDQSFVYYNPNSNSSASDLTSPVTPTFSHHGGSHLRYASSTSSLDLQAAAASSTCSDSPVSPAQPLQPSHNATSTGSAKRLLPDVQEEPLERDGDGDAGLDFDDGQSAITMLTDDQMGSLYDCLCTSALSSFPTPGRRTATTSETNPPFPTPKPLCGAP